MEKIIDENKQGESLNIETKKENTRKLFIESYGCAMNFSDSEIVASILSNEGFNTTQKLEDADLVLVNTCSIRDKAEQTVRKRLEKYNAVIRLNSNGVTAFVSITRGCDNMCTFCVVPFTRGRERSRDTQSIIEEVNDLWQKGYKEITLLGQNVDSYLWYGGGLKKDFVKATEMQKATAVNFAKLLELCAQAQPKMRIRFSTSNPQDMTLDVVETMAKYENICNYIHLPVQSGSDRILKEMNRQHTREEYMVLIDHIKRILPECTISQDMITGFPTETEDDHQDTLSLMRHVKYAFGYMFAYSERPGTMAERKMEDDIPLVVKKRRLQEVIDLQLEHSFEKTQSFIGQTVEVLIEKEARKGDKDWSGRNSQNLLTVFPKEHYKVGDFVNVKIIRATKTTLIGEPIDYSKNN
ncbi:UNVERIFIED_CONTAM: hypothetical protein GTU68_037989 [Idotea baltica]|nr:hypothetical protein [Idotea baltica]